MTHDLAMTAWGASMREIRGVGSNRITVTIPREAGGPSMSAVRIPMMRGTFVID